MPFSMVSVKFSFFLKDAGNHGPPQLPLSYCHEFLKEIVQWLPLTFSVVLNSKVRNIVDIVICISYLRISVKEIVDIKSWAKDCIYNFFNTVFLQIVDNHASPQLPFLYSLAFLEMIAVCFFLFFQWFLCRAYFSLLSTFLMVLNLVVLLLHWLPTKVRESSLPNNLNHVWKKGRDAFMPFPVGFCVKVNAAE